ncbi:hypothetical protein OOT55_11585 [Marinimicrobium sp. C6131]|uniref:imelysin family protein n=1 Tax=Marinimicrobium sp. C6131 TaxID=3022676 RepID=UPI00223D4E51|nr:imelysin family protein [Marinimicrobium sp. C6131]UZJ43292.1 hypothetical protein OOT55_11585 [Marinimicrobium sp. C6131]
MAHHQPEGLTMRHTNSLLLVSALLIQGCDPGPQAPTSGPDETPGATQSITTPDPALADSTLAAWQQGSVWLSEARTACADMHERLDTFLAQPDEDTLAATREAWHHCHTRWHHLEPLLTLGESSPGLFGDLREIAFQVDAHPIQPGYLDGLENYPYSGIVNDITVSINAQTLREQHGLTDEADVALGLHALEFLLWDEQGDRPISDFEARTSAGDDPMNAERTVDQLPNNRRRALVRLISQLLQDDLTMLAQHWQSSNGRLPATYRQLSPASRLPLLSDALRVLLQERLPGELARLETPEQAHNAFAGQSLSVVLSAISGIDQLMNAGDPPMAQWLIPEAEGTDWQTQWQALNQTLSDTDRVDSQDLSEQLRALGQPLSTATPELMPAP